MAQATGQSMAGTYTAHVDASRAPLPARRRRATFLAITAVMIAIVIAGFWPYFRRPLGGDSPRPWVIHLHAAVFSGWMLLLLAQVLLVVRRRSDLHRRLGRLGIGYGIAVLALGLIASIVAPIQHVATGAWTLDNAASFLILPLGDMVLFGTVFATGIVYRRQPEIHKRCMLLATVALMFAPAARLAGDARPALLLAIWMLPLLIAVADDLWTRRRVHMAYVLGTAFLLVGFTRIFVADSAAWLGIGRAILIGFGATPPA